MVTVLTILDRVDEVIANIKTLTDVQVMVGIPATRNSRKGEPITNAALGYLHEHGSPVRNLPARPFLVPGVQNAQDKIASRLGKATVAAVEGKRDVMFRQLNSAGMEAMNSVRRKITEGPFAPLAPSTMRERLRKLYGTTALTQDQIDQGFKDIRPLIDTGQLRRSVTYVIRNRSNENIGGKP